MNWTPGRLVSAFWMLAMQWSQEMSGASSVSRGTIDLRSNDTVAGGEAHRLGVGAGLDRVIQGGQRDIVAVATAEGGRDEMIGEERVLGQERAVEVGAEGV